MAINFDYKAEFLRPGADTNTGSEWCWYRGDTEITKTQDGELVWSISIHAGATVVEVKAIIRDDAKK